MYCYQCGNKLPENTTLCNNCDDKTNYKIIKRWPTKLAIITLFITILPLDYGVYYVGKTIISIVSIYYCFKIYNKSQENQDKFFWYFLGIAILYNPIIPIHLLFRIAWIVVDIITIIIFNKFLKSKYVLC